MQNRGYLYLFKLCILSSGAMGFSTLLFGQDIGGFFNDLEQIEKRSFTIAGSVDISGNFYGVDGIAPRRDNSQWQLRANLNFNLFGINAPFSLAFSDSNEQFGLPSYTFAGLSPSYKWARLHIGDRSLSYSKYTLNGINFKGIGFEVEPGKYYVSGMYGRLRRAREEDFNSLQALDPIYKRMGYGIKAGYRGEKQEYHMIIFGAHDDENSISAPVGNTTTPSNNIVVSLSGRQKFLDKFNVEAELAHSTLNEDKRAGDLGEDLRGTRNSLFGVFTPTTTVTTGFALKSQMSYSGQDFSVQTGYERINRGFKTLGALFFLSDVEYITLGGSKTFLENKLNVYANIGIERTNLDDFERSGTSRFVGSLNANYNPSADWQFSGSYSNFQNSTRIRAFNDPNQLIDTVLLAQTTQTTSFVTTHVLPSERPSTISFVVSYQEANSIIDDIIQEDAKSRFTNTNLMYTTSFPDHNLGLNASINYNKTVLSESSNSTYSMTTGANKGWLENKLQTNIRLSYNKITSEMMEGNSVFNGTLGSSLSLEGGHALRANFTILHRTSSHDVQPRFWEWYGGIGYNYRFSDNLSSSRNQRVQAAPIADTSDDNEEEEADATNQNNQP